MLGSVPLRKLTVSDIESWQRSLAELGVGASTRRDALIRLRTALKLAERRGPIVQNVATLVEAPNVQRIERPAPDADRIRRLVSAIAGDIRLRAFVLVCLSGPRRSEALGLTWGAINFDRGALSIRKRVNRVAGKGLLVRSGAKTEAGLRTPAVAPIVMNAVRALQAQLLEDRELAAELWRGADDPVSDNAFMFVTSVGSRLPRTPPRLRR